MVLVETLQAEKENAYTDYVSIPVKINHWTFNGRNDADQGLIVGTWYQLVGHLAMSIATSALVSISPYY